jgi:hypothetical protein
MKTIPRTHLHYTGLLVRASVHVDRGTPGIALRRDGTDVWVSGVPGFDGEPVELEATQAEWDRAVSLAALTP